MGVMEFLKKLKTDEKKQLDLPPLPPEKTQVDFPEIKIDAPQFTQSPMMKDERFPFPSEMHADQKDFENLLGPEAQWDDNGIDELPGLQPIQAQQQNDPNSLPGWKQSEWQQRWPDKPEKEMKPWQPHEWEEKPPEQKAEVPPPKIELPPSQVEPPPKIEQAVEQRPMPKPFQVEQAQEEMQKAPEERPSWKAPWQMPKIEPNIPVQSPMPFQAEQERFEAPPWQAEKKEEVKKEELNKDYVSYARFQNVVEVLNSLSKETKIAEDTVFRLKDIHNDKEEAVGAWQAVLEDVEKDLVEFDQALFG
jgi:hypothetical protein